MPAVWGWHGLTAARSPVLHGRKAPAGPSQDGAATAAPLGVVQRVHLVFKPVDVVEVRLPQVLVVHFCDGDLLDGLTLGKETEKPQLAKQCLELVLCADVPQNPQHLAASLLGLRQWLLSKGEPKSRGDGRAQHCSHHGCSRKLP